MNSHDKAVLFAWIRARGVQIFFEGLAKIADDHIAALQASSEYETSRDLKIEARQWKRTAAKLEALAAWTKEFGPGSGCL